MEVVRICFLVFLVSVLARDSSCLKFSCMQELMENLIELEYKVNNTEIELFTLIEAFNQKLDTETQTVAFSAFGPVNKSPSIGDIIVFGTQQLNEGNAYDKTTGVFTAPVDGLYQFNVNICNSGGKYFVYAIVREETTVALTTQWDDSDSCNSLNAVTMANAGDRVFVKPTLVESTFQLYENVHRRNTFTGVLLRTSH